MSAEIEGIKDKDITGNSPSDLSLISVVNPTSLAGASKTGVEIPIVNQGQKAVENKTELYNKDAQIAKNYLQAKDAVVRLETGDFTIDQLISFRVITEEQSKVMKESTASLKGTGFFITPDGWMVTNAHVAMHGNLTTLIPDGRKRMAQTLYLDAGADVAIIKVGRSAKDETFPYLPMRFSKRPKPGEDVTVVGHPLGWLKAHCSPGYFQQAGRRDIISPDAERKTTIANTNPGLKVYEARMHIEQGNSGSPVLDSSGKVIGVVFGQKQENMPTASLIVPSEQVRKAIEHVPALKNRFNRHGDLRQNTH